MQEDYFEGIGGLRQMVLWTVATRQALERWESSVASAIHFELYEQHKPPGRLVWLAEIDRHFTFVAAHNLIRAVRLIGLEVKVDEDLEAAVTQHRHLLEHWDENMPVFNVEPREVEPRYRSGKEYALANPSTTPYGSIRWNSSDGPTLGSDITAAHLHAFLDDAQARAVVQHPGLEDYIPERRRSPWLGEEAGSGRWFPRPPDEVPDQHT